MQTTVGYVTLGTRDHARALSFFDDLLGVIGIKRLMELDTFVLYGKSMDDAGIAIVKPYDGKPATVGNGVMVALRASSKAEVNALHKKALELGGTDEGQPGPRGDGFYAAYFRDLDGNKFAGFFLG